LRVKLATTARLSLALGQGSRSASAARQIENDEGGSGDDVAFPGFVARLDEHLADISAAEWSGPAFGPPALGSSVQAGGSSTSPASGSNATPDRKVWVEG
jgi:hypothetical protein